MQTLPTGKPLTCKDSEASPSVTAYENEIFQGNKTETSACALTTHWLYSAEFLKSLSFVKSAKHQAVQ